MEAACLAPNVYRVKSRRTLIFVSVAVLIALPALADDAATASADARVLLAHAVRSAGIDPRSLQIDGVQVTDSAATVRWHAGSRTGALEMRRQDGRWLAGEPGAPQANWPGEPISAAGGTLLPERSQMSGYEFALNYSPNDAQWGSRFSFVYGRTPTRAEFLPYPTVYPFTSDAVFFFDLAVAGSKPVTFGAGSTLNVWVPFVLDDKLHYDLFLDGADRSIGPIVSSVYDNTLRFVLPKFTAAPGKTIGGEIDGDPH